MLVGLPKFGNKHYKAEEERMHRSKIVESFYDLWEGGAGEADVEN